MADTAHRTADAGDLTAFYGKPGKPDAPTLALVHGLPSASLGMGRHRGGSGR